MPSDMTRLSAVIFCDGGSDTLWYRSIWGPAGSIDSGSRSHVACFHIFTFCSFHVNSLYDFRYLWPISMMNDGRLNQRSHKHPNRAGLLCFSLWEVSVPSVLSEAGICGFKTKAISFSYFNKGSLENQIRRNFVTFLRYIPFKRLEAMSDNCGFIQI